MPSSIPREAGREGETDGEKSMTFHRFPLDETCD